MRKSPRFDIILVTRNLPDLTVKCLHSIAENSLLPDEDYRVIWIDNNSHHDARGAVNGTLDVLNLPSYRVHLPKNEWFIRATNIGLCLSRAPFVVLLNNDTEVPPGWLESMVQWAKEPGAGVVVPLERTPEGRSGTIVNVDRLREMYSPLPQKRCLSRTMVPFFCAMLPRRTIEEVGLLSTKYDPGMADDDDYCLRIRKAGLDVVLDLSTIVNHVGRATWNEELGDEELEELIQKNREKFLGAHRQDVLDLGPEPPYGDLKARRLRAERAAAFKAKVGRT